MLTRAAGLALLALTLTLAALPAQVAGHAAPNPLDNEIHLLEDEGEDAFYYYDGYDLFNLFAREAYMPELDETGLIFRFTLYGGFSQAPAADNLHIDITATGEAEPATLRLTTPDDASWSGDLTIVALNVTQDELPWPGVTARVQAFAPYTAFNATPGATLSKVTMASLADEDLRDIAPGGIFLPMSGGQGEVPMESQRVTDPLELTGPTGYLDWQATTAGNEVTLTVENLLSKTGQHVQVRPGAAPGWTVDLSSQPAVSVDAGETATFTLQAQANETATAPLPLEIITDLGGRTWAYLGVNGTQLSTFSTSESAEVAPAEPANESPGLGLIALPVLAIMGLLAARFPTRDR